MKDRIITKGKLYYSVLAPVWKKLTDIPYAVIKGEPLSVQLFGCCGKRDCSDVDILLPRSKVEAVQEILHEEGFEPIDSSRAKAVFYQLYSHQTMPMYRMVGNVPIYVDLNTDLFWGEYTGWRIDLMEFLSDTETMYIYGQHVKVLSMEKAVLQYILHCFRDMNSVYLLDINHGYQRKMFEELHVLLETNRERVTPDIINRSCVRYEISEYAYCVMLALWEYFHEDWIWTYAEHICNTNGMEMSACFGLNAAERRRWNMPFQERFDIDSFYRILQERGERKLCQKIDLNRMMMGGDDGLY